ncbi:zinc-binding dehydrogenase [Halosolutus halophilus]|uniref:zinc-binding dehydrogenase n=1 Tax=Halosolutus halophilus TaxID=1552990 RepID=UPI00223508A5|nr:zinc-binding dehydrogenase [Halosolutus halophilus]
MDGEPNPEGQTSRPTGEVVYFYGPGELAVREHPVPEPEPGAVVTEVVRTNVCGSDVHISEGRLGEPFVDMVLGHEAVCRVTELGPGVETDYAGNEIAPGDLVAPVYYLTCQHCSACARGEFHNCQESYSYKTKSLEEFPHFHGTYGTHYYVHPNQHFYKVPDALTEVPSVAAAANCALSQVMFGLDQVDLEYDETVVIQGAGGLGLNATAYANERGAEVIVVEGARNRLKLAKRFGADHVVDMNEYSSVDERIERVMELTNGEGADVAAELAGVPEAFTEGIELLQTGGRYLEVGNINPGSVVDFDPGQLTRESITVEAMVQYDPWYLRKALSFLADTIDVYPYEDLLDETFDLAEFEAALEVSAGKGVGRASLDPQS